MDVSRAATVAPAGAAGPGAAPVSRCASRPQASAAGNRPASSAIRKGLSTIQRIEHLEVESQSLPPRRGGGDHFITSLRKREARPGLGRGRIQQLDHARNPALVFPGDDAMRLAALRYRALG